MSEKICLFAGTTEGRQLAGILHHCTDLTVCVATEYGEILLDGQSLAGIPAPKRVSMGISQVPEGRRIFPDMSVFENLEMGAYTQGKSGIADDLEMVFEYFPRLKERRKQIAGTLSGGEQQMLAVARALMAKPKMLLMDEPSLGLAPLLVKSIFDIMQGRHSEEFHHIRDIAVSSIEKIEDIYRSKGKLTGVPTGFVDFDAKTAGLQKSDLVLLAARPSMGKTAFALNIIQNAAIRHNVPTAVFSLEMSREQLVNRMLCSEAMLDAQKLRTGELDDNDWAELIRHMGPLSEAPIYIDDTPGVTPMEVRSKCRRLKVEKGLGLIVIDYLQLMHTPKHTDNRVQEVAEISRSLKIMAKELNVPVLCCCQLSRGPEGRQDKRPMLSDLRESGSIEQDADIVLFIYRDDYYNSEGENHNAAELIVAKNRHGETGKIDLQWLGQYTAFLPVDNRHGG